MKYIFFTIEGQGIPIAYRLQEEGNDVVVGIVDKWLKIRENKDEGAEKTKRRTSQYDEMVENKMNADDLLTLLEKVPRSEKDNYFVVCDSNMLWPYADKVRSMNFMGLLPTKEDRDYEEDRKKAKDFFKTYDVFAEQDVHEFKKVDDAIAFLEESESVYVVKGYNGDAPTIVPETNDPDIAMQKIVDVLEANREAYEKGGFILEEKIDDIIEFTPEGQWFGGKLLGVSIDIEAKGLGSGDSGRQTGCSMDSVFWLKNWQHVYEQFLKPIEKMMQRDRELCIGDVSVLYSPSRKKFYAGEFCFNRWGYNAIFTQLATFPSVTEYFERVVQGEKLFADGVKQFGGSMTIFNLIDDADYPGLVLKDSLIISEDTKDIWIYDVKAKKGKLYTAGYDAALAVITGAGDSFADAVDDVYETEVNFHFTGKYTRPKHDYLSEDYATSIPYRYKVLNGLVFDEPEIGAVDKRDPELATAHGRPRVLPYKRKVTESQKR